MIECESGQTAHECLTCGMIFSPGTLPAPCGELGHELQVMDGVECSYPVMEPESIKDLLARSSAD